jgi:hypothetical protein
MFDFESGDGSAVGTFRAQRSRLTTSGGSQIGANRGIVGGVQPDSLKSVGSQREDKERIIATQTQGRLQVRREPIDLLQVKSRLMKISGRFRNATVFVTGQTFKRDMHGGTTDLMSLLINLAREFEEDLNERAKLWVPALGKCRDRQDHVRGKNGLCVGSVVGPSPRRLAQGRRMRPKEGHIEGQ